MIILDEQIPDSQRRRLLDWGFHVWQIGWDIGHAGMDDVGQVLPLLHSLRQPTFFTLDLGFYHRRFCHDRYCLVVLDVADTQVAEFVRKFLRHPLFRTKAKRMGKVVLLTTEGIRWWAKGMPKELKAAWL
ncbi:MAG: hypothetical protein RRB24_02465 [Armatimonadota bacterium]|nr:hypothetical protein [Armatimonadota bacterium]MDT7971671.1 hypothetical protein [Armatimonadota bacterium]